jgi:hypothetical protein
MARPGPETQAKRRREQAKKQKRMEKEEKKALRKARKDDPMAGIPGSDPGSEPAGDETAQPGLSRSGSLPI